MSALLCFSHGSDYQVGLFNKQDLVMGKLSIPCVYLQKKNTFRRDRIIVEGRGGTQDPLCWRQHARVFHDTKGVLSFDINEHVKKIFSYHDQQFLSQYFFKVSKEISFFTI